MSEQDSTSVSKKLHSQNQTSSSHTEYKSAPYPDLSGSGDSVRGN